jgi:hypothetical protein
VHGHFSYKKDILIFNTQRKKISKIADLTSKKGISISELHVKNSLLILLRCCEKRKKITKLTKSSFPFCPFWQNLKSWYHKKKLSLGLTERIFRGGALMIM